MADNYSYDRSGHDYIGMVPKSFHKITGTVPESLCRITVVQKASVIETWMFLSTLGYDFVLGLTYGLAPWQDGDSLRSFSISLV